MRRSFPAAAYVTGRLHLRVRECNLLEENIELAAATTLERYSAAAAGLPALSHIVR